MAAATPTSVSSNEFAANLRYGTARRYNKIIIEVSPAATNTLDVSTYVPSLSGILSVNLTSSTAAVASPNLAFSGTTLTFGTAGAQVVEVLGYY